MDRFKAIGVPAEIIDLIKDPPLLEGESKEQYFALLSGLLGDYGATTRVEFLGLIRYANCYCEIRRLELARARIIGHWQPLARVALIRDHNPAAHKEYDELLQQQYPNGVDSNLLNGRAVVLANDKRQLAYLDQQIEWCSRECQKILQSLSYASAVFAPGKRAAEK